MLNNVIRLAKKFIDNPDQKTLTPLLKSVDANSKYITFDIPKDKSREYVLHVYNHETNSSLDNIIKIDSGNKTEDCKFIFKTMLADARLIEFIDTSKLKTKCSDDSQVHQILSDFDFIDFWLATTDVNLVNKPLAKKLISGLSEFETNNINIPNTDPFLSALHYLILKLRTTFDI